MYKIDLHTHSSASPDGGITPDQYAHILEEGILDYVAITDHDTIELAQSLHKTYGDKVIIGEEISTADGEIVGLFLSKLVTPGLPASKTAELIHEQGGLVYVPHPFETVRKGLPSRVLDTMTHMVDIMEVYNGRAVFQNRGPKAVTWARLHQKATAASSDAHGTRGLGATYTHIKEPPTNINLPELLALGHHMTHRPPLYTLLYPKHNRLMRKLKGKK